MQLRRILALYLSLVLGAPSFAQSSGVSVQQDNAAKENLGRVIQSPEARSVHLPSRNTLQSQPTLVLPDMGDPGGDALSPVDERRIGERIMREIRRRTRVVGAFPDGQSCLNLAAARLRHIAGTQWSTKRYMNMRPLFQAEETQTEAAVA